MIELQGILGPAQPRPPLPQESLILLRAEHIDPAQIPAAQALERAAAVRATMGLAAEDPAYYIVQFDAHPTRADRNRLTDAAAGVVGSLRYNAYVVRARPAQILRIGALPGVRWTGIVEPKYKIAPELTNLPEDQERVRIVVQAFPGRSPWRGDPVSWRNTPSAAPSLMTRLV